MTWILNCKSNKAWDEALTRCLSHDLFDRFLCCIGSIDDIEALAGLWVLLPWQDPTLARSAGVAGDGQSPPGCFDKSDRRLNATTGKAVKLQDASERCQEGWLG